mgnify:FL=1
MKQEAFLQDVDWVDALKLRASYGEVGNNMGVSFMVTWLFIPLTRTVVKPLW